MYVRACPPAARRRPGIAGADVRDDRAGGNSKSVLLASHAGALLYPNVGYEQIGALLIFAPRMR
jgi:hypothetical protein